MSATTNIGPGTPALSDITVYDIDGQRAGVVRRVTSDAEMFFNSIDKSGRTLRRRLDSFEDAEESVLAAHYGGGPRYGSEDA